MAEDFEWCKDLEAACTDDEGKSYCVFHAPRGRKSISSEEFNRRVLERITDTWTADEKTGDLKKICDLSGAIFEGDFHVGGVLPGISFRQAQFTGNANFAEARFTGGADFIDALFEREANFVEAQFAGEVSFRGAVFMEAGRFFAARFMGQVSFRGAVFHGEANFWAAQFTRNARFWWARFNGEADFWAARFMRGATFRMVQFTRGARFLSTRFDEETAFTNIQVVGLPVFENVNLDKVCFVDTDVRDINFINCQWQEKSGRRVVFDETKIPPVLDIVPWSIVPWTVSQKRANAIKKVETVYRRLKQKYKEDHNEEEASIWHYSEKEMQRKRGCLKQFFELFILHLYCATSGYGERLSRAFGVLVGLIAAACVSLAFLGLEPSDTYQGFGPAGWNDLILSERTRAVIVNVFKYITFQRDPYLAPGTQGGECVKLAAQVLIPVQAALFVLALRNRFRR